MVSLKVAGRVLGDGIFGWVEWYCRGRLYEEECWAEGG
jgi:hypothetical protein